MSASAAFCVELFEVGPANDCEAPRADRLTALYREHRAAILARCRRLLRDDQAADDATQETFIRVARHVDRAPAGREALPWMYRIATNLCLNELRDRRTERDATAALAEVFAHTIAGPESAVANRELVRQVLEALPEKVRIVALLRHAGGMHDGEVAEALGVGRRTVVYRLAAFREKAGRRLGVALT